MSRLINKEEFKLQFGESLNKAMLEEAEPLIQEALKNIEEKMRKNVAANLIAFMQSDYNIEIDKNRLIIKLGNNF